MLIKKIYYLFLLFLSFVFTQDPPQGFEYNQGFNQSFYFFLDLNIDGEPLSEQDWIGAFKTYDETNQGECVLDEIYFDEAAVTSRQFAF